MGVIPKAWLGLGELLPSGIFRSWSRTETRVGEEGNPSSTGFRGMRIRLGDPEGLCGRIWGENKRWPVALVPGMDWVRPMGGAKLAADRDLTWLLDNGEDARGRWGRAGGIQDGEMGEDGDGSVDRRMVGGFRRDSNSGALKDEVAGSLRLGSGDGRNSSILSVSGTGSMLTEV
jgi:hypothetical protein